MQRQIETRNFLAVYFAVSSQNGESPLRDEYQRPEQSRATVPRKNKSAWPKLTNFDEFCYEDSSKVRQKSDE